MVPENKVLFTGTGPANKVLFSGSVLANKVLFAGTVPANNSIHISNLTWSKNQEVAVLKYAITPKI